MNRLFFVANIQGVFLPEPVRYNACLSIPMAA